MKKADSLYNKAMVIFSKVDDEPGIGMETNLNDYATLQIDLGNYKKAEHMLREALGYAEKIKGSNSYETASVMNNLAISLDYLKILMEPKNFI